MKKLNAKQILIVAAAIVFFTLAAVFVYLKRLRIEMTAEAGIVAGITVDREQRYFNSYGEFAALEERSGSEALGINFAENKYFDKLRIETVENTVMIYAVCTKGFFKGTELYVEYNNIKGVTDYRIKEKTKIPLPRL
jgi:hypothetical protein